MAPLSPNALPPSAFRASFRSQAEDLIALLAALDALDMSAPLEDHTVDEWKATARLLDSTLEVLGSDAAAGMTLCMRVLTPDLAPRFDELRATAKEKAQALLDRLEDEVLLTAWAAAAQAKAQPADNVSLDEMLTRLDEADAAGRAA